MECTIAELDLPRSIIAGDFAEQSLMWFESDLREAEAGGAQMLDLERACGSAKRATIALLLSGRSSEACEVAREGVRLGLQAWSPEGIERTARAHGTTHNTIVKDHAWRGTLQAGMFLSGVVEDLDAAKVFADYPLQQGVYRAEVPPDVVAEEWSLIMCETLRAGRPVLAPARVERINRHRSGYYRSLASLLGAAGEGAGHAERYLRDAYHNWVQSLTASTKGVQRIPVELVSLVKLLQLLDYKAAAHAASNLELFRVFQGR